MTDISLLELEKVLNVNEDKKIPQNVKNEVINITENKKKYIKGGRLFLYPSNMNLYRCSKGVKRPVTKEMYYDEAKKKVKNSVKTFENTVKLYDDNGLEIVIQTECYNKIRKKN